MAEQAKIGGAASAVLDRNGKARVDTAAALTVKPGTLLVRRWHAMACQPRKRRIGTADQRERGITGDPMLVFAFSLA
jgi:hypothetical protein